MAVIGGGTIDRPVMRGSTEWIDVVIWDQLVDHRRLRLTTDRSITTWATWMHRRETKACDVVSCHAHVVWYVFCCAAIGKLYAGCRLSAAECVVVFGCATWFDD